MNKADVIIFVVLELAWRAYETWKNRSIFKKAADSFLAFSAVMLATSIWEYLIDSIVVVSGGVQEVLGQELKVNGWVGILTLLIAALFYVAAYYSERNKVAREKLVFNKRVERIATIHGSKVFVYLGSVTQVSDIEVVVTSEDTDLNLGSLSGSSVSGRIRRMAATYDSQTRELIRDELAEAVGAWKAGKGKYSNFPLGTCVRFCNLANIIGFGVKCVVLAVAIRKNEARESAIDKAAIGFIVEDVIRQAIANRNGSIFIPVFGLGSGNIAPSEAISATCSAIQLVLRKNPGDIDVYIGVYRVRDFVYVNKAFV